MTKIIARLMNTEPTFRVLFDGEDVPNIGLTIPKVEEAKTYEPLYIPESKSEWFYVELDLEQIDEMLGPYRESNTLGTNKIEQAEYININAILEFKDRKILFSRVSNAARIGEKGRTIINFEEDTLKVNYIQHAIDFSSSIDAYYDGQKRIYFQKYSRAKPLFKGFEVFYQNTSRTDKELFLEHELFAVSDINIDFIGIREAKLIESIAKNPDLDLSDPTVRTNIRNYANNYPHANVRVNDDDKLKIASKEDLTAVLKLLSERYFTSEITGQKFEARSSTKLEK